MPLSDSAIGSKVASVIPSLPIRQIVSSKILPKNYGIFPARKSDVFAGSMKLKFMTNSVRSASVDLDVPFPEDYSELLEQAKKATALALEDNKQLMEIEFPTAGLESVPGDGEGGNEMTGSMLLIRDFLDRSISSEKVTRTRVFFPEANEVTFARNSAFEGASFKLDYLTKPSFFEDFGFVEKVKMKDRVKPEDELFLVSYPYFNVNEMLVVEELYKEAVMNTTRKLIIFNGELDRIRSGYATQVRGKSFEESGISTFVFINKKLCLPLRKLPWIFFHQLNLHDTYAWFLDRS